MDYFDWNNRLAKFYFNEEMAGREVLLYVNRQIIRSAGEGIGDVSDFIDAVIKGPPGITRTGICQKALKVYENWRDSKLEYPPYLAFLVLFVLAEDVEGDFDPRAYYPRLNQLIGLPDQGPPPSVERMIELWDDLEKWSKEDKHEELGRFTKRIRGGWVHVGLPLSQTILSRAERENLPIIFSDAELDPTDPPSADVIRKIFINYEGKSQLLERRTTKLLEGDETAHRALKIALLEFILDELTEWDQTAPAPAQPDPSVVRETKTGLRICLRVDNLSRKVTSYLRFKSNKPIPDTGLNFMLPDGATILLNLA